MRSMRILSALFLVAMIATSCAPSRLMVTQGAEPRLGNSLYDPGISPSDYSDSQACWQCRGSGKLERRQVEFKCTACNGAGIDRQAE